MVYNSDRGPVIDFGRDFVSFSVGRVFEASYLNIPILPMKKIDWPMSHGGFVTEPAPGTWYLSLSPNALSPISCIYHSALNSGPTCEFYKLERLENLIIVSN